MTLSEDMNIKPYNSSSSRVLYPYNPYFWWCKEIFSKLNLIESKSFLHSLRKAIEGCYIAR